VRKARASLQAADSGARDDGNGGARSRGRRRREYTDRHNIRFWREGRTTQCGPRYSLTVADRRRGFGFVNGRLTRFAMGPSADCHGLARGHRVRWLRRPGAGRVGIFGHDLDFRLVRIAGMGRLWAGWRYLARRWCIWVALQRRKNGQQPGQQSVKDARLARRRSKRSPLSVRRRTRLYRKRACHCGTPRLRERKSRARPLDAQLAESAVWQGVTVLCTRPILPGLICRADLNGSAYGPAATTSARCS
jgi:hypothetical protein